MSGQFPNSDNPLNPSQANNGNMSSIEECITSSLFELSQCGQYLNDYLFGDGSPKKNFEEKISELWEMSAIEDYVDIFERNEFKSVIIPAIRIIPSVRIVEICLGIMTNLSINDKILKDLSLSQEMINIIQSLSRCDEARILVQVFRFLHCALSNKECCHYWKEMLDSEFFSRLLFVLKSSTWDELIRITLNTFDVILYNKYVEIELIGSPEDVVESIFSSFYQLNTEDSAVFNTVINILDSLTEEYFCKSLNHHFIKQFFGFAKWILTKRCDCEFSIREELCQEDQSCLMRLFCFVCELTSGSNRGECVDVVNDDSDFVESLRNFLSRFEGVCPEFENTLRIILENLL